MTPFPTLTLGPFNLYIGEPQTFYIHHLPALLKAPYSRLLTLNSEILSQLIDQNTNLIPPRCVADGNGVRWLFKFKTKRLPPRLTGLHIARYLLTHPHTRACLIGGPPGLTDKIAKTPHFAPQICFHHHGYTTPAQEKTLLHKIQTLQPNLILVGMGFPKQEHFLKRLEGHLTHGLGIGIGGALEVLAGTKKEAPLAFQALHLEWLYRVLQDPKRLKRLRFVFKFMKLALKYEAPNLLQP